MAKLEPIKKPIIPEKLFEIGEKPRMEKSLLLKQSILYGIDVINRKSLAAIDQTSMNRSCATNAIVEDNESLLGDLQVVADNLGKRQGAHTITKQKAHLCNQFVIKIDSPRKAQFDNVMIVVSTYNVFS